MTLRDSPQARERDEAMTLLRGITGRRREAANMERALVHHARNLGISWQEIGGAVGVPPVEARRQYGEPVPDSDDGEAAQ